MNLTYINLMDRIEFVPTYSRVEDYKTMDLHINGINLIDRLAVIERRFTQNSQVSKPVGMYEGLPLLYVILPAEHFLGKAIEAFRYPEGKISLLEYGLSGIPGEWPFVAHVKVEGKEVIWSDFAQYHQPNWDYSELGILRFDLDQYLDALSYASTHAY